MGTFAEYLTGRPEPLGPTERVLLRLDFAWRWLWWRLRGRRCSSRREEVERAARVAEFDRRFPGLCGAYTVHQRVTLTPDGIEEVVVTAIERREVGR